MKYCRLNRGTRYGHGRQTRGPAFEPLENRLALAAFLVGPLTFDVIDGEAVVQDCDDTATTVVIPTTVSDPATGIEAGVTRIGSWAFTSCDTLTSVTIPNSVASIDIGAFSGCLGLTSITIPGSVDQITNEVFSGCTGLVTATLGEGVKTISGNLYGGLHPWDQQLVAEGAFSGCTSLTTIAIPASVTSIEDDAFGGCSRLASISADPQNAVYASFDGILYDKTATSILWCPPAKTGSVSIPSSVTGINGSAFSGCAGLTSVTIPGSVKVIGSGTFAGCTSLKSIAFVGSPPLIAGSLGAGVHGIVQYAASNAKWARYAGKTFGGLKTQAIRVASAPAPPRPTVQSGTVRLSWRAPTTTGGAPVTDYIVQLSRNNGRSWTTFHEGVSAATTATLRDLAFGSRYMFRVAAANFAGQGMFSAKSTAIVIKGQ